MEPYSIYLIVIVNKLSAAFHPLPTAKETTSCHKTYLALQTLSQRCFYRLQVK